MAHIKSTKELKKWLENKPTDWAQVLASRAALRVFPYAFHDSVPTKWLEKFALSLNRANFFSWSIGNGPSRDLQIATDAAYMAVTNAADSTAFGRASPQNEGRAGDYAAYFAGFAAAFAVDHSTSINAIENAIIIAGRVPDFWTNLNQDALWLESWNNYTAKAAARRLTRERLWPYEEPQGWRDAWSAASARLLKLHPSYSVWIEWYERRIAGYRAAFNIPGDKGRKEDISIIAKLAACSDNDFWLKGAKHVNTELQDWINEARDRLSSHNDSTDKTTSFFISYATQDESIAREVSEIISDLGYSSTAQFKDFAQGNFVRKMREGIAQSDRFIALQSKAYWNSDHCQSEWDAAYRRDPGAKQRKIVPFLLEPVPLPPIASEIVYKPLFNLSKSQRRKAIIEWIEYQPSVRTPAQLRRRLAEQASPDVCLTEEKIDAGPNSQFDRPLVDLDLAELPANLRSILKVLLDSLPGNTPPIVANCLNGYYDHLIERGTQPIVGTLVPFAEAIQVQVKADQGYWDAGLESLFVNFFKRHELLITHFPLNQERELIIAETVIDEQNATGDALLDPVKAVGEALAELKSADLTTDDFNRVEEAHQEFSRDIASLPMPNKKDEVTPKRRYVLGTIGFYERLLAALGAGAGISSLPQGQAAIAAVRAAIEAFMRFII